MNDEAIKQQLCGYEELASLGIPYSRMHIRRLQSRGCFPQTVKLGPGKNARVAWRLQDILEWIATRTASSPPR
jgi:predicted DNA-binding transcriptional regulator AlpA